MPTEHQLNRDCRKEVRRVLAERPGIALDVDAIAQRCQGGFKAQRVSDACLFLLSRKHVEQRRDDQDGGGDIFYEISADGIVAYENGN